MDMDKIILKLMWKGKGKRTFWKVIRISLPNFKSYFIAKVIKTVCYWKDRHISQWNKIENPETDSHEYAQLIWHRCKSDPTKQRYSLLGGAGAVGYA